MTRYRGGAMGIYVGRRGGMLYAWMDEKGIIHDVHDMRNLTSGDTLYVSFRIEDGTRVRMRDPEVMWWPTGKRTP